MTTATQIALTVKNYEGPDDTYFTVDDVKPFIENGTLYICNYKGTRRSSWGQPSCTSYIKQLTDDVVSVSFTGWHKHTVSPVSGTYYFVKTKYGWVRKIASAKAVKEALATK